MATFIGVTGGIGTGKSTVCRMLHDLGAKIIDADQISRDILQPGTKAYGLVIDHFGKGILDCAGYIDRAHLGKIAFKDRQERRVLENITHPAIKAEVDRQFRVYEAEGDCIVVLEAPLLIEAGMEKTVDEVWVVVCSAEEQLKRVMSRGHSLEEAQARIAAQLPLAVKIRYAHRVIDTDCGLEETRAKVTEIWCFICGCE